MFLKKAAKENNIKAIKDTAHRMLTMCRQLKAIEVIPILEKIEEYCPDKTENHQIINDLEQLELKAMELLKELKAL